jgi:subtilisin family serine protease
MGTARFIAGVSILLGVFVIAPSALARDIPDQWIAVFDDEVTDVAGRADAIARARGVERGAAWSHALKGFVFNGSPQAAAAVARSSGVAFVEPDRTVEAFCHTESQEVPAGIASVGATQNVTAAIDGVDVRVDADIAILDTGIYSHGDLNEEGGRHWNCTSSRGCVALSAPKDDNGHGTHVAGTAAAIDDTRGVVGMAPGARLWSVKVLDRNGSGTWSWVINGLNVVAANAARIGVANLSLGGASTDSPSSCNSSALHKAICGVTDAGVTVVVAAGNDGSDAGADVPAKYDQVITVSALDAANGMFASFSNFGGAVDLAAPGVGVLSTWPGDRLSRWGYCAVADGTSMAAPHVAGAVALFVARYGRDCNHDGRVNAADTTCIRDYLVRAGRCADGSRTTRDPATGLCLAGWPGDPDGLNEPLLFVAEPF